MKISRIKKAAIGTIAVMALAGAGAGSVFAVDTNGVEATEVAEPAGTGVEVDAVGGYADTVADAQTEQTGEN